MAMEAVMLRVAAGKGMPREAAGLRTMRMPHGVQCVQIALASQSKSSSRSVGLRVVAAPAVARQAEQEVSLESEIGVSYETLRDKLAAGEWEAADAETRRLLCVLAGEAAEKRKWVYFSEVQFIPEADLKTIDGLWRAYSGNKFGYSVQRRIWKNVNQSWTSFFLKVGWTRLLGDSRNAAYKKFPLEFMWDVEDPTPSGHLPLTNALRGTQLLEKLLTHPAFDFAEDEENLLVADTDSILQSSSPPQEQQSTQQRKVISDDMTMNYGF